MVVSPVLVLGASGQIGLRVSTRLAGQAPVRALVHSEAGAERVRSVGVDDLVFADLADPSTLPAAFEGVERVFLLSHGTREPEQELHAVEAAVRAGVRRVVKLSSEAVTLAEAAGVTGEARDAVTVLHQDAERALAASGMDYVALRPTWFQTIDTISFVTPGFERGEFVWPGADSALSLIAPDDVADVAVACLLADALPATVLDLTGPAALGCREIAAAFGVRHVPVTLDEYEQWLIDVTGRDAERARFARRIVEPFVTPAPAVTDVVEQVLGRPARPL